MITQEQIHAPAIDVDKDEPLTQDEVDRLYRYYGASWDDSFRAYQAAAAAGDTSAYRGGTSGRPADDAMTRSEERLRVGTQTEQAGRARLRKYVVTEQQTVSGAVRKEHIEADLPDGHGRRTIG